MIIRCPNDTEGKDGSDSTRSVSSDKGEIGEVTVFSAYVFQPEASAFMGYDETVVYPKSTGLTDD
jgi:hypothetical protein